MKLSCRVVKPTEFRLGHPILLDLLEEPIAAPLPQVSETVHGEAAAPSSHEDDVTELLEQARAQGRTQALAECEAKLAQEREHWLHTHALELQKLSEAHTAQIAAVRSHALDFAVQTAGHILGIVLEEEPALRKRLVALAMSDLAPEVAWQISVPPGDISELGDEISAQAERMGFRGPPQVLGDGALKPGEVVVRGSGGTRDGRIEPQLLQIQEALHPETTPHAS